MADFEHRVTTFDSYLSHNFQNSILLCSCILSLTPSFDDRWPKVSYNYFDCLSYENIDAIIQRNTKWKFVFPKPLNVCKLTTGQITVFKRCIYHSFLNTPRHIAPLNSILFFKMIHFLIRRCVTIFHFLNFFTFPKI